MTDDPHIAAAQLFRLAKINRDIAHKARREAKTHRRTAYTTGQPIYHLRRSKELIENAEVHEDRAAWQQLAANFAKFGARMYDAAEVIGTEKHVDGMVEKTFRVEWSEVVPVMQ